jgi:hypothetical protein
MGDDNKDNKENNTISGNSKMNNKIKNTKTAMAAIPLILAM